MAGKSLELLRLCEPRHFAASSRLPSPPLSLVFSWEGLDAVVRAADHYAGIFLGLAQAHQTRLGGVLKLGRCRFLVSPSQQTHNNRRNQALMAQEEEEQRARVLAVRMADAAERTRREAAEALEKEKRQQQQERRQDLDEQLAGQQQLREEENRREEEEAESRRLYDVAAKARADRVLEETRSRFAALTAAAEVGGGGLVHIFFCSFVWDFSNNLWFAAERGKGQVASAEARLGRGACSVVEERAGSTEGRGGGLLGRESMSSMQRPSLTLPLAYHLPFPCRFLPIPSSKSLRLAMAPAGEERAESAAGQTVAHGGSSEVRILGSRSAQSQNLTPSFTPTSQFFQLAMAPAVEERVEERGEPAAGQKAAHGESSEMRDLVGRGGLHLNITFPSSTS